MFNYVYPRTSLLVQWLRLHAPMHACAISHFSHIQLCAPLWTVACQAPLSKGFSRPKYWSELCPPPGDLTNADFNPWAGK